ncbi:MAG: DUF6710 family protein [Thermus sp.]
MEGLLRLVERLLEEGAEERALRRAVRLALLPLQARGLTGWAGEGPGAGDPWSGLPRKVRWRLTALGGLPEEGEEVAVELGEVPVLSFPWNGSRLQGALHLEAWREDPENHRAYLVLPPGTLLFYNGLHSGAVAALEGRGRVRARVLDLSPAFRKGLRVAWRGGVPLRPGDNGKAGAGGGDERGSGLRTSPR